MPQAPTNRLHNAPKWIYHTILATCLLAAIYFFSQNNFASGVMFLLVPFVLFFVALVLGNPLVGFKSMLYANYFALGIGRYVPGPLGLSVDGLLVLTWLALFFSQFNHKVAWRKAAHPLTLAAALWYGYALFQMVNPESVSRVAWFYAMRGVSLYMFLTVPLVFLIFDKPKHLNYLLQFWAWCTLLAVAKGLMQKFLGPDPAEKYWLDTIGGKTHRLSQGLRIFSFFSDAATYGGSMGFSGVVYAVLGLQATNRKQKRFYLIVSVMAFYAMLISGTRGAIAVPFGGFAVYAVLSKRVKVLIIGGIAMLSIYSFLKFSTLGNNVYEIRRFRGGLDPNNPSLMVRHENAQKLKLYLASRPFGGGIGSAGNWGLRFSPGTFLAETPTDGWFTQIWAEQGIIGLWLHLGILAYVVARGSWLVMFTLKTNEYRSKAAALLSGMVGVMAASYGSSALGQMPNGIIIYSGMAYIFLMAKWEKEHAQLAS